MYFDPMGALAVHRAEAERIAALAERRRSVAARTAEQRSRHGAAPSAPEPVEGDSRMPKLRPFRLAS